jgi:hypothetical protein
MTVVADLERAASESRSRGVARPRHRRPLRPPARSTRSADMIHAALLRSRAAGPRADTIGAGPAAWLRAARGAVLRVSSNVVHLRSRYRYRDRERVSAWRCGSRPTADHCSGSRCPDARRRWGRDLVSTHRPITRPRVAAARSIPMPIPIPTLTPRRSQLSKASLTIPSWNQLLNSLRELDLLRQAVAA